MSGYEGMEGITEYAFAETDVQEMAKLIEEKKTFAVFFSYADCPYCNRVIPYLNRAAQEAGQMVGYVDTRKDPSWISNMDLTDYDLLMELIGDYQEEDGEGKLHLYVPDLYFFRDGEIVARHQGIIAGADDPEKELTESQEAELNALLADYFGKIS